MFRIINKLIPSIDKLKHFYLFSIGLTLLTLVLVDYKAYIVCFSTAVLWELFQKLVKKGNNSIKEMINDIFFGGVLPIILHLITII